VANSYDTQKAIAAGVAQDRAMSELVEQVARAIHDVLENDDDSKGGGYMRAARAALSVLEPRIEALEAENFKLAAGACNVEGGLIGDDHGHFDCSLKARIEALERELAEAVAVERFCRECGASVAVDLSFMACHCRTMIWPIRNGERGEHIGKE